MSEYQKLCLVTLLGSTLSLPTQALDNEQLVVAYNQDDIVTMRSELHSLEASVERLENRLASIERQRHVPTQKSALAVPGSTTAQDLEKAIQELLEEVTEQ